MFPLRDDIPSLRVPVVNYVIIGMCVVAFLAQLAAPGEEPRFFDDLGCLRDYLATRAVAPDAVVFVADHRTGEWVQARDAVYSVSSGRRTPMSSGIVAHGSRASRDVDPAAAGGVDVPLWAILGEARK